MDERLRDLERRVAGGDLAARADLIHALERAGREGDTGRLALRGDPGDPPRDALGRPLVLAPADGGCALLAVEEERTVPIGRLPFDHAPPAALLASPFAIGIGDEGVHVHRLDEGLAPVAGSPFALPEGFQAFSVARSGRALYVGGTSREPGRILAVRDLEASGGAWEIVPVPERIRWPGKTIDGLAVVLDRLLAVDNIVTPHLVLEYAIASPTAPRFVHAHELAERTLAHHVVAASVSEGVLVVVARQRSSGSYVDDTSSVSAVDARTLEEIAYSRTRGQRHDQPANEMRFTDATVVAGVLVIAGGAWGLGFLDLEPERAASLAWRREGERLATRVRDALASRRRLPREGTEARRFPLELAPGEGVLRVAPAGERVVVTIGPAPRPLFDPHGRVELPLPAHRHLVLEARKLLG
ncbi:MAG TPA: hypothetical protein VFF73_24340 [Planctomycetota bacterium]|nr:hypothetical protein [Planctomycetota bacterium]